MPTEGINAVEGTKIRVLDKGEVLELGHDGPMTEPATGRLHAFTP
ncbi:hypothetical protein ENSA5_60180 [Enhygromyxa salina]|uniref:Uncharacterized protein n=1 Tax=Enhygromyxa salina TaxID=215803 RepID=A0A2S9XDL4_9BACT|nr:hypothetical protein [Enhygromyxa salina]PRP90943.1 hypothetical protein ENSA5_60180 [Enhygromyxa salina]